MNIDVAYANFQEISSYVSKNLEHITSEQDCRLNIINRILVEVLRWNFEDIKTEGKVESGYFDYLLSAAGKPSFIVEAKKTSANLIDTTIDRYCSYNIFSPAIASAKDGIKQAQSYAIDHGIDYAALTNGLQWLSFYTVRTDGKQFNSGKAIVFPTLAAIDNDFARFYELFSKDGVASKHYRLRLLEAEGFNTRFSEKLSYVIPQERVHLIRNSQFSIDMSSILREFLDRMDCDKDKEMLLQCFVESHESREADATLRKITKDLISHVEVLNTGKGEELEWHIEQAAASRRGEFVLIVGNKGAGKSTFVDRFFSVVLPKDLSKKCLIVRVDLKDSAGIAEDATKWATRELIRNTEFALYGASGPVYDDLQGVFFSVYQRWSRCEYAHLYSTDKEQFKIKFGEYILELQQHSPDVYLSALLNNAVKSRDLLPCIVFDNADHHNLRFQETIFLYAQTIFRETTSFIVCPITDRTIWRLSKDGPFQSFETTTLYLPVPQTGEVIEKRIRFLRSKLEGEASETRTYLLQKGIRLKIEDMRSFAACIEEIFVNTQYITGLVGALSNYNIRRTLVLCRKIITSPHIKIEDIIKIYIDHGQMAIRPKDILHSLLRGGHTFYSQDDNEFLMNLFVVDPENLTSPLLKMSILTFLNTAGIDGGNEEDNYVLKDDILSYFSGIGVDDGTVVATMKELLDYALIEPYDVSTTCIAESRRFAITPAGKMHLQLARSNDHYLIEMALRTPVRGSDFLNDSKARFASGVKITKPDWLAIKKSFIEYVLRQDNIFISLAEIPTNRFQILLRNEMKKFAEI